MQKPPYIGLTAHPQAEALYQSPPPPPRSWVLPEPALSRAASSPHPQEPGSGPSARSPLAQSAAWPAHLPSAGWAFPTTPWGLSPGLWGRVGPKTAPCGTGSSGGGVCVHVCVSLRNAAGALWLPRKRSEGVGRKACPEAQPPGGAQPIAACGQEAKAQRQACLAAGEGPGQGRTVGGGAGPAPVSPVKASSTPSVPPSPSSRPPPHPPQGWGGRPAGSRPSRNPLHS